jgi:hypothetical protein
MADDASDDGRDDGAPLMPMRNGNLYAQQHQAEMNEVAAEFPRKQKILAKIICVPGKKTYVAEWMKEAYEILLEADPETTIVTQSGLTIATIKEFPSGTKFKEAFKPIQSDDTKKITMHFHLTSAPPLNKIKIKHRRLVDYLQKRKIYLDESFSGSNEEVLIGYFLGIQADKLYLTGFADDLREVIATTKLQPGEHEFMKKARDKLDWPEAKPPPFHVKVRNITRHTHGEEYSSKAVGIIVAKEHAQFFRTLLTRACNDKILHGMGMYYNVVSNDRTFPRIIKWHNEQIATTATIPVIGITREAMKQPIYAQRKLQGTKRDATTTIRKQLSQSSHFIAVHSTRQTFDEGRWILVIKDKSHTDEAIKFFDKVIKEAYGSDKPQINADDLILLTPTPQVEEREHSHTRYTYLHRNQQSNAWNSLINVSDKISGGSQRSKRTHKQKQIVEISFDPESRAEFPNLQRKNTNKSDNTRNTKQTKDQTSPNSSQGDSTSAVTRAEFETFSQGISKMVRDEVQSTISNNSNQSMITAFREEMTANRNETQAQIKLLQQQFQTFQTFLTNLAPHISSTNPSNNAQTNTETNDTTPKHLPNQDHDMTQPGTQEELKSPPSTKTVHIADQSMPDDVSHDAPSLAGTPSPSKRLRGHLPGNLNSTTLTPLAANPRTSTRGAIRVPIPTHPPSTTVGKKTDRGRS